MGAGEALPLLGFAGTAAAVAFKSPDLLKEVYGDLAKPGVSQVGKALSSVIGLGNTILLPLRLLNEFSRQFEVAKFNKIASRFSNIPEEDVIPIRPEIGVPILEHLSYTQDVELSALFVELLAKAANSKEVEAVHPSFVNVIANLSPDEAVIVRFLEGGSYYPFISVNGMQGGPSFIQLEDFIMKFPENLAFPSKLPIYMSNLTGLGLIEVDRGRFLSKEDAYDSLIEGIKERYAGCSEMELVKEYDGGEFVYLKSIVKLSDYGSAFRGACVI